MLICQCREFFAAAVEEHVGANYEFRSASVGQKRSKADEISSSLLARTTESLTPSGAAAALRSRVTGSARELVGFTSSAILVAPKQFAY